MNNEKRYASALPVEQQNPYKADKVQYFSQLHSYPKRWEFIARRTCGTTAAAMAMSLSNPSVSPMEVLLKAAELHTVPSSDHNFWFIVENAGQKIRIPIGMTITPEVQSSNFEITDEPPKQTQEYSPIISMQNGYDHRGSRKLFAQFGIDAQKMGDKTKPLTEEGLKTTIASGHVFMASVKNSVTR